MKTIYSLQEFRSAVLEIAKGLNESYTTIYVEVDNVGNFKFKAYIYGLGHNEGNTPDECLNNIRKVINKEPVNIVDLEIDLPPIVEPGLEEKTEHYNEELQPAPAPKDEFPDLPF